MTKAKGQADLFLRLRNDWVSKKNRKHNQNNGHGHNELKRFAENYSGKKFFQTFTWIEKKRRNCFLFLLQDSAR